MKKLPLTIIILTNRSDQRFHATLKSAQVAEEVLVIDNKSGNDWGVLRERYSLIALEKHHPIQDYSQVRNEALAKASHEWVLFLDSDEVLTASSLPALAQIISENNCDGVIVRRSDVFHGRKLEYGEAGNQPIVRLGKKQHMRFTGNVHETAQIEGKINYSTIELLHYSHPNISDFLAKISVYAEQVAQERTLSWPQFLVELIVFPPAKFFRGYIMQGGSQDGWHGLVYAACMSLHSLIVRIYAYEKSFSVSQKTH